MPDKTDNKMIPCSICGKADKTVLEDSFLGLFRCGWCGHAFKNLKNSKEKYGEDYFLETHKNWFNNPDYPLFDFIHKRILRLKGDKGLKILDVGCGNGNFLKYLRKKDRKSLLYGIDLINNAHPDIKFIKGDILAGELGMKFDVVCNFNLIEHLGSPHMLMKKINDLLLPGGIAFIVTDNDDSMVYKVARLLKKVGMSVAYNRLYSAHHLQCFANRSLKVLTGMNGFDLIMRRNHNYPVKAVDYPDGNSITKAFYIMAIRALFSLSTIFNNGVLQIAACKKKE
jgi:SAM-dependent methyltransferase